jgi:TRAP-type C4-dicarboxylate transport system substrate-binding protein
VDKLTPENKEALYKAAREASDFYGKTTQDEEKKLIAEFESKGVKFVDPGLTVDQMRKLEEPLKQQLPEVYTWAQKLAGH